MAKAYSIAARNERHNRLTERLYNLRREFRIYIRARRSLEKDPGDLKLRDKVGAIEKTLLHRKSPEARLDRRNRFEHWCDTPKGLSFRLGWSSAPDTFKTVVAMQGWTNYRSIDLMELQPR